MTKGAALLKPESVIEAMRWRKEWLTARLQAKAGQTAQMGLFEQMSQQLTGNATAAVAGGGAHRFDLAMSRLQSFVSIHQDGVDGISSAGMG